MEEFHRDVDRFFVNTFDFILKKKRNGVKYLLYIYQRTVFSRVNKKKEEGQKEKASQAIFLLKRRF